MIEHPPILIDYRPKTHGVTLELIDGPNVLSHVFVAVDIPDGEPIREYAVQLMEEAVEHGEFRHLVRDPDGSRWSEVQRLMDIIETNHLFDGFAKYAIEEFRQ